MAEKDIKTIVKEGYGKIAVLGGSCCGPASSCCGSANFVKEISSRIGYSEKEIQGVPEGANLGLAVVIL